MVRSKGIPNEKRQYMIPGTALLALQSLAAIIRVYYCYIYQVQLYQHQTRATPSTTVTTNSSVPGVYYTAAQTQTSTRAVHDTGYHNACSRRQYPVCLSCISYLREHDVPRLGALGLLELVPNLRPLQGLRRQQLRRQRHSLRYRHPLRQHAGCPPPGRRGMAAAAALLLVLVTSGPCSSRRSGTHTKSSM